MRKAPIEIILEEYEQKLCRSFGRARYQTARDSGVENKKIGDQSNEETDVDGFAAELAFAKLMNLYPDLSIGARRGGVDLLLGSGKKVDVKQTKYPNGRLLAAPHCTGENDYYVLMTGSLKDGARFTYRGFATKAELINEKVIVQLKKDKPSTYGLEQDKLHLELPI